jgi:hypothetical protein
VGYIDVAIAMQWCGKHISVATDTDATIEDAVLCMQPMLRLYNDDQMDKPVSRQSVEGQSRQLAVLSCIVSSCYLATASEKTEDFICTVVVMI